MRKLILATLLLTAAACGSTKNQAVDPNLASQQFRNPPPQFQQPVNVSRSTESGPSGAAAGVGR